MGLAEVDGASQAPQRPKLRAVGPALLSQNQAQPGVRGWGAARKHGRFSVDAWMRWSK